MTSKIKEITESIYHSNICDFTPENIRQKANAPYSWHVNDYGKMLGEMIVYHFDS